MINHNVELADIDEEFLTTHEALLARFYNMFESIYRHACVKMSLRICLSVRAVCVCVCVCVCV